MTAAPIVKWVGGKTKLLPELLQRIPSAYSRYYEPFAGGAALFFALSPERAVLGDANADLIAMYRAMASDVELVIGLLEWHRDEHSEAHYYAIRDAFNAHALSRFEMAAAFLYLNRVCFNGLFRRNRAGAFNVPMGRYKNPAICDAEKLRAASAALANADLRTGPYYACVHDARAGDLVYFDPPYDGTFTAYTGDGFTQDDQRELAACARILSRRGVRVVLSNADTPFVRELYAGFDIGVVRCPRAVNSNAAGRGDVDELIIVGRESRATTQLDLFSQLGGVR